MGLYSDVTASSVIASIAIAEAALYSPVPSVCLLREARLFTMPLLYP
ncbi:hypothetical protein H6F43_18145 [Leptolyngbya sp. FACHB-36]|nr:hypothetical protein [Leptolyngbya sp. FACHB-36]MBD2022103.1 hypothetical protein [Leptolyngbya sp. FACHB-36]